MGILGVDCSTTTIGITALDDSGAVVYAGFIKPKGETIFDKVLDAEAKLCQILNARGFAIDKVVIEKPVKFARSGSSAQTISLLNWFNGAIWYILYRLLGVRPTEFAPETARKIVMGVGRFPKGTNTKEKVFQWVSAHFVLLCWPLNRFHEPAAERYDIADAIIIALAQYRVDHGYEPKKK